MTVIRTGATIIINCQINFKKTIICILIAVIATCCFMISGFDIRNTIFVDLLLLCIPNICITVPEGKKGYVFTGIILLSAAEIFLVSQIMVNAGIVNVDPGYIFLNILICGFVLQLSSYFIDSCFLGIMVGSALLLFFSTADYLLFNFRGSEISPLDFFAIETALNVSEGYEFPNSPCFVTAWTIHILFLIILSDIIIPYVEKKEKRKPLIAVSVALSIIMLFSTATSIRWGNQGSMYHGLYANFLLELRESRIKKPIGYSIDALNIELSKYMDTIEVADERPNIIVIMNESFTDLQNIYNHIQTSEPVIPYYYSLKKNIIKGVAYSSVYGGSTSCSEYEFLTGNTMAFLPPGSVPYQQFVDEDTYSMVSVLKNLGYRCEAMHPYYSNGYNRNKAYPLIGFDETFFLEDFTQADTIRNYISDRAMYEKIVERFDAKKEREPIFLFGVTVQNHGGFSEDNFNNFISITEHEGEFPEAEQYFSLLNISDSALKFLIEHFKRIDEKTIIVFFGDHHPNLSDEFAEYAIGKKRDDLTLSKKMNEYKIPFFIWANYSIESAEKKITSLNYLSSYVYDTAGIHTAYGDYLQELSNIIPAVNSQAYYSISEKKFKKIKNAKGKEYKALQQYKKIQYNVIKDKKNRLTIFDVQ